MQPSPKYQNLTEIYYNMPQQIKTAIAIALRMGAVEAAIQAYTVRRVYAVASFHKGVHLSTEQYRILVQTTPWV